MRLLIAILMMIFSLTAYSEQQLDKTVYVGINTSEGYIELELNETKAPLSVANFLSYVNSGHYNNTIFHRVIKDFMIQGGGFSADMRQKPTQDPIKNEAKNGLNNARGTVAMARTSAIDSATSQFFINVKNNTFLDHGTRDYGYAVFGRVTQGMDVVDRISEKPTAARDVPRSPIVIYDMHVIDKTTQDNSDEKLMPS